MAHSSRSHHTLGLRSSQSDANCKKPRRCDEIDRDVADQCPDKPTSDSDGMVRLTDTDHHDDASSKIVVPRPPNRTNFISRHQYSPRRLSNNIPFDSNDRVKNDSDSHHHQYHGRRYRDYSRSSSRKHPRSDRRENVHRNSRADSRQRLSCHDQRCRRYDQYHNNRHDPYHRQRSSTYHRHYHHGSYESYGSHAPSSNKDESYNSTRSDEESDVSDWSEISSEPLSERIHRWATSTPKDVYVIGRVKGVDPRDPRECLRMEHLKSVNRRKVSILSRRDSARSRRDSARSKRDSARSKRTSVQLREDEKCGEEIVTREKTIRLPKEYPEDGRRFIVDHRCDDHSANCRCEFCLQQRFECGCQSCLLSLWNGNSRIRDTKIAGNIVALRIPQHGASHFQEGFSTKLNESRQHQLIEDWIRLSQAWCLPLIKQMNDQKGSTFNCNDRTVSRMRNNNDNIGNVMNSWIGMPLPPSAPHYPIHSQHPQQRIGLSQLNTSMVTHPMTAFPPSELQTLIQTSLLRTSTLTQTSTPRIPSTSTTPDVIRSPPAKRRCSSTHGSFDVPPHQIDSAPTQTGSSSPSSWEPPTLSVHNLRLCSNVVSVDVPPNGSIEMEDPLCAEDRGTPSDSISNDDLQKLRQAGHLILESILNNVPRDKLPDGSITIKTPQRFSKMMIEMTEGYRMNPKNIIQGALFNVRDTQSTNPPLSRSLHSSTEVVIRDLPIASLCEHHLLPFHGTCNIAYIPKMSVLGLSKFSRVVDAFSHRLQLQERLTEQISEFLFTALDPYALAITITATHGCMILRGVRTIGSSTTTRSFLVDQNLKVEWKDTFHQQLFSLLNSN